MDDNNSLIIFVDGSSTVFKDKKGLKYGGIGIYCPMKKLRLKKGFRGPNITNQKMELCACIYAIEKCVTDNDTDVLIYSDSMYVINISTKWVVGWIKNGWKRKEGTKLKEIENLDLIKKLHELNTEHKIKYKHVRSHQQEPLNKNSKEWFLWKGNDVVDKIAFQSMEEAKNI